MTPQLLRRAPFKRVKRVAREAALDIVIIYTSYVLATLARSVTTDLQIEAQLWFFASATLLTVILLYVFGAYRRLWARTSGHGIVVLINAVGLAYVIATLVDLFIVPRPAPLSVIAIANIMAFVGVVGVRYRSRVISGLSWRWDAVWNQKFPTSQTRVMIVGAGEAGQALAWRLKYRSPGKHYSVVCFVDD